MMRRCRVVIALSSLILLAGCSMMIKAQEGEPVWLMGRVSRRFAEPSHRVALAMLDVFRAELTEVQVAADELSPESQFNRPDGQQPTPDDFKIPDDVPAFWLEGLTNRPVIVNLSFCDVTAREQGGREVQAVVRIDVDAPKRDSVVSVQVGRLGDEKASNALLDKIAQRLAHPTVSPGSAEEHTALMAAFGPAVDLATGKVKPPILNQLRIRKP